MYSLNSDHRIIIYHRIISQRIRANKEKLGKYVKICLPYNTMQIFTPAL